MVKKENIFLSIFSFLFIFSITMLFVQASSLTGFATEGTTVSNVTISKYLSISMSTNLSEGILFGSVDTLPSTNINATHNYDGVSTGTSMFVNVSADSNTNVDFCIRGNADMTSSGGDTIGLGNETYSNSSTTSASVPALGNEVSLTTSYVRAGVNVSASNSTYYRFWLDVPSGIASGTYNNTISFKGIETGTSC